MSITAERIDSAATGVDSNARKALLGSAIGYAMDGFDLLILGFMLRTISSDLGLSPAQSASLVTATLIGAVLGGIFFGLLCDRL
jgi:MFS family permease